MWTSLSLKLLFYFLRFVRWRLNFDGPRHATKRLRFGCGLRLQLGEARARIGEGLRDAVACGATDHVVAIERGFEGNGGVEVFGERFGEGAEFGEGKIV